MTFNAMRSFIFILGGLFLFSSASMAQITVGEMARDFTLKDIHGVEHRLSDTKGKIVVLEWLNPQCPYVDKHYRSFQMQALQKEVIAQGHVWFTIVSGHGSEEQPFVREEVEKYLQEKRAVPTAVLLDPDRTIEEFYGVQATPEMVMIDAKRFIVYRGAIDSIPSEDPGDIQAAENYVRAAFKEVVAGQEVTLSSTEPYGCPCIEK